MLWDIIKLCYQFRESIYSIKSFRKRLDALLKTAFKSVCDNKRIDFSVCNVLLFFFYRWYLHRRNEGQRMYTSYYQ